MGNAITFLQPAEILRQFIDFYYFIELTASPDSTPFEQKPVSNGCVEMFISYHDTFGSCLTNSGHVVKMKSAIVGPHDLKNSIKGMVLEADSRICKFVAVCFKPQGFYSLVKKPLIEIYNNFVAAEVILGNNFKLLEDQLSSSPNRLARKEFLDHFFIRQLSSNYSKSYNFCSSFHVVNLINKHHGIIKMHQLVEQTQLSERKLQRDFRTALGLSPKEYCKIVRFNHLLNYISSHEKVNWLDMVLKFGYYDQAHLINEFKNATHISPEVYMKFKNKSIFNVNNHLGNQALGIG